MRYTATHRVPGRATTPLGKLPTSRALLGGAMLTGMLASGAATASAASASDLGAPVNTDDSSSAASASTSAEASWPTCDGDGIPNNCPPLDGESSSVSDASSQEDTSSDSAALPTGGSAVTAAVSSASASGLVDAAQQAIGTDYAWGGESLSGMDCSGLIHWAYEQAGISLDGNRTADQIMTGGQSIPLSEAQPGDVVGYKTGGGDFTHAGIYVGNGKIVDASNSNSTVVERGMWSGPDWQAVSYR